MRHVSGFRFGKGPDHPLAGVTVLQILPEVDRGGEARATIETAEALGRAGGIALVAAAPGSMLGDLQARGGLFIPFPARSKTPFDLALNVARLVRLVHAERIDVLHARSRLTAWIALGAARLTRTPLVTNFHACIEPDPLVERRFNSIMTRGDRILVSSTYAARLAEKLDPRAIGRIQVVGHGVDHKTFSRDVVAPARVRALRERWNIPPDAPIVLVLAPQAPSAAHRLVGETAATMRVISRTDTWLVCLGAGNSSTGLVIKGFDDCGRGAGLVARAIPACTDWPAALLAASALAVPSGAAQGSCRIAVAAQAMGVPVIVADEGDLAETVVAPPESPDRMRTGWRVPPRDVAALAATIKTVLSLGASARDLLSFRARAAFERRSSTERLCVETLRAYAAVRVGMEER